MSIQTQPYSVPRSKPQHMEWVDILRFFAMFMVVMVHGGDSFNFGPPPEFQEQYEWWGAFYGSMLRPCVPLFTMMTGLLLLPIRDSMPTFYKKRIPRIMIPFLIWSIIYCLYPWFVGLCGGTSANVNQIFPFAPTPDLSLTAALQWCALIPVNFSPYGVHMWYVYMLVGLYLFMPIFSAWVTQASEKAKFFILCVWLFTTLFPYSTYITDLPLFGVCAWNGFQTFYYFGGFIGYLLLGHWLVRNNHMNWKQTLSVAIPLFAIGFAVTFIGFRHIWAQRPNITDAQMELFWTFNSMNVVMQTVAVFIVCQKLRINIPWVKTLLADMAKFGFGIYLVHYFIVSAVYQLLLSSPIHAGIRLPLVSLIAFFITYLIVKGFSYLPKSKWITG